jgi:hypothetical protein
MLPITVLSLALGPLAPAPATSIIPAIAPDSVQQARDNETRCQATMAKLVQNLISTNETRNKLLDQIRGRVATPNEAQELATLTNLRDSNLKAIEATEKLLMTIRELNESITEATKKK